MDFEIINRSRETQPAMKSPVYKAAPHKMGLDNAVAPEKPGSAGAAL
jgi:hypothetical protein